VSCTDAAVETAASSGSSMPHPHIRELPSVGINNHTLPLRWPSKITAILAERSDCLPHLLLQAVRQRYGSLTRELLLTNRAGRVTQEIFE